MVALNAKLKKKMKALNAKLCRNSDFERQVGDAALNAKLKKMKALNAKLCRDSDSERQTRDVALNAKLKKMKVLNTKLKKMKTLKAITEK